MVFDPDPTAESKNERKGGWVGKGPQMVCLFLLSRQWARDAVVDGKRLETLRNGLLEERAVVGAEEGCGAGSGRWDRIGLDQKLSSNYLVH